MTLKAYLIIMSITTLLCWLAFGFVLRSIDPYITNWVGFLLFYGSLFLTMAGTSAIIGFLIRFAPHPFGSIIPKCFRKANTELRQKGAGLKRELVFNSVRNAFRQSFFFAFLIMAALILLSKDLFTWGNLILLISSLSVLEFFLISYKKS
ncbi:MAG: hypothetical protein KKF30_19340 [Proteobacteria bacterium]|nr:hypothetical protein [Pseudomonadota bacterium]MBU4539581.1 hypothetical protein [Bacteroidota bacterium]MCG2695432.1 hypothetical protein [Candidatus Parcubacteria bacterium]MCG2701468.1 hypothetical protein [Candidatus Parcubacteria bacterium]